MIPSVSPARSACSAARIEPVLLREVLSRIGSSPTARSNSMMICPSAWSETSTLALRPISDPTKGVQASRECQAQKMIGSRLPSGPQASRPR